MEDIKEKGKAEVLSTIKEGVTDTRGLVKEIAQNFDKCAQSLRMGEYGGVFTHISENIQNLQSFMDFLKELKEGLNYLGNFDLPADPLLNENTGLNLFKEMHSAFESEDWVLLSDLIQYELNPLLFKEEEWLGTLDRRLEEV